MRREAAGRVAPGRSGGPGLAAGGQPRTSMNAKNLPLKFALIAVMVALSIWSISARGLKQGIDLRGGHSLAFEIRPQQGQPVDKATVAGVIANVKERIDPQGLRQLEFRPRGVGRFEVRMPAASEATQQAKEAYRRSLDELTAGNIRRSEIVRIAKVSGKDRDAAIAEVAGKNTDLANKLEVAANAYQALQQAQQKQTDLTAHSAPPAELDAATDEVVSARSAYRQARQDVLAYNIDSQRMELILGNYVSQAEAERLKTTDAGREQMARRTEAFDTALAQLKAAQPSRADMIQQVVERYKQWAENRQELEDPSDLKRLISKVGVLEFRIAPLLPAGQGGTGQGLQISRADYDVAMTSLQQEGPDSLARRNIGYRWFPIHEGAGAFSGMVVGQYSGQPYLLLADTPDRTMLAQRGQGGWQLTKATQGADNMGRLAVDFQLDAPGASRMGKLTGAHNGDNMAILLDDEVYSAPVIKSTISSSGQITGRFTREEVNELARTLNAGSLPARINPNPVAENSFGPSIGAVNREHTLRAGYYSMIAVCCFMVLYYMIGGSIADVALMLNIVLVLGAMSLLGAVFTMAGIAGVILTIGMAVDANVLIFERLREEQEKSHSIRMALKNAYERAFSAIIDTHMTTLLTCLILAWLGTEEVRGFAIALGLGVAFSLFTSLVVTRWVFQVLVDKGILKQHLLMLRLIHVPKINWMGLRYYYWAVSTIVITLGLIALFKLGPDVLGVEFRGGTEATITLRDDALIDGRLPDDALVRERYVQVAKRGAAKDSAYTRLSETATVTRQVDPGRVDTFLDNHDTDHDGRVSGGEWSQQSLDLAFFKLIDKNGDGFMDRTELNDRLPSGSYQVTTIETNLELIRNVAVETFGNKLKQKSAMNYRLAAGESAPELGIQLAPDGLTRIQGSVASVTYPDLLEDFADGLVVVFRDVDPATTEADLRQRIRDMQDQPDFANLHNETEVLGLTPTSGKDFKAFAVLVRPPEASETSEAWAGFAAQEMGLLKAAMSRGEAMTASNFDAAIAGEAVDLALIAIVLSWIGMIVYLWARFGRFRWGAAAVICLIHDVFVVVGMVAASAWISRTHIGQVLGVDTFKIDLAMVAAVLTVIGYSVNDTIVVFDRIRENRGKLTTVSAQIINSSINQTLSRTILTSFTVLLVVAIMYIWGGPGIHAFNYALLVGIAFGTYSSIAIAAPILLMFKGEEKARRAAPAAVKPQD